MKVLYVFNIDFIKNMKKDCFVLQIIMLFCMMCTNAQVDYSVLYVNEESGTEFTQMTTENDYVCMPEVHRSGKYVKWLTNRILDISIDGTKLAYLSMRNNTSNIFIKDVDKNVCTKCW